MTKSENQVKAEMALPEELREPFTRLVEDYRKAAGDGVPGYKGGTISFKIAAELIRLGWRRPER